MSIAASRLSDIDRASEGGSHHRLRDLFTPLDTLLVCGGDQRLALDPKERVNATSGPAMRMDGDAEVMRAIENSLAQGRRVLLQTMDSSKLGWRAPSAACLDEIARRWPRKVQVAVDACQARPVTVAWSADSAQAQRNVQHILDRIAHVLVKIELLLDHTAAVPAQPL